MTATAARPRIRAVLAVDVLPGMCVQVPGRWSPVCDPWLRVREVGPGPCEGWVGITVERGRWLPAPADQVLVIREEGSA